MDLNSSKDMNLWRVFQEHDFYQSFMCAFLSGSHKAGLSDHGELRQLEKGSAAEVRVEGLKREQEHSRLPGQYRLQV